MIDRVSIASVECDGKTIVIGELLIWKKAAVAHLKKVPLNSMEILRKTTKGLIKTASSMAVFRNWYFQNTNATS